MSVFIKNQTIGPNCGCIDCNADPCAVAQATLVFDGISSSKYKFGYVENYPYISNPPKVYVKQTMDGYLETVSYLSGCVQCVSSGKETVGGYCEYYPKGVSNVTNYGYYVQETCLNNSNGTSNYCTDCTSVNYSNSCDFVSSSYTPTTNTATATTRTYSPTYTSCTYFSPYYNISYGGITVTISDEFTTTQLINLTVSSLPPFSGNFNSTSYYAGRELSGDEKSFTYSVFQYQFILPAYDTLKYYKCYKINWQLKYQLSGGEPVVSNYNYIWNGIDGTTPVYGPVIPPDGLYDPDSIIFVSNVTYSCSCT